MFILHQLKLGARIYQGFTAYIWTFGDPRWPLWPQTLRKRRSFSESLQSNRSDEKRQKKNKSALPSMSQDHSGAKHIRMHFIDSLMRFIDLEASAV